MERSDIKSVREFIEQQLNDPSMRNLISWSNEEQRDLKQKLKKFQIFWLHAGRSSYNKNEHQKLFVKYRIYRGRTESDDPKQTFRMALKKSPHIECLPVNQDDDWRYYRFKGTNISSGIEIKSATTSLLNLPIPRWGHNNDNNDNDSGFGSTPPSPGGSFTTSPYRSQPPSPCYDYPSSPYQDYPSSPVRNPTTSWQQENPPFYPYGTYLTLNPFPPGKVPTSRPRLPSHSSTNHMITNVSHSGGTCYIPETTSQRDSLSHNLVPRDTGYLVQNQDKSLINENNSFLQMNPQEKSSYIDCQSNTERAERKRSISLSSHRDSSFHHLAPRDTGYLVQNQDKSHMNENNSFLQMNPQAKSPYIDCQSNTAISERKRSCSLSNESNEIFYTENIKRNATNSSMPEIPVPDCSMSANHAIHASTPRCVSETNSTPISYFQQQGQSAFMKQKSAPESNVSYSHCGGYPAHGYGSIDDSPDNWTDNYVYFGNMHNSTSTNCLSSAITIPEIKITSDSYSQQHTQNEFMTQKFAQEFFQQQSQNKLMTERYVPTSNVQHSHTSGYGPVDESPDNWVDNYDNSMSKRPSYMSSTTASQEIEVQETQACVPNLYINSSTNTNELNPLSNQQQNTHQGYIRSGENNMHTNILGHNPSFHNSYSINPTHSSILQPSSMEIQREYHTNASQTSGYGSINECPDMWMEDFELYTDSTI